MWSVTSVSLHLPFAFLSSLQSQTRTIIQLKSDVNSSYSGIVDVTFFWIYKRHCWKHVEAILNCWMSFVMARLWCCTFLALFLKAQWHQIFYSSRSGSISWSGLNCTCPSLDTYLPTVHFRSKTSQRWKSVLHKVSDMKKLVLEILQILRHAVCKMVIHSKYSKLIQPQFWSAAKREHWDFRYI